MYPKTQEAPGQKSAAELIAQFVKQAVPSSTAEGVNRGKAGPMNFIATLTHADGVSYGERCDPWQREDFHAALETTRHVWLERPRGHSKTADMAAIALTELVTGNPGQRIYAAAADQDQARILFDSLKGFINRSESLRNMVNILRDQLVVPAYDSTLSILASDAAGSWGLRPSLLIVDEIHAWRGDRATEFFQSLFSSLGKVEGARMLVGTTAGWDRTSMAWQLREMVQNDPAWIFSRRGQCASWVTQAFLDGQRALLPAHVYRMLHDNEWVEAGGAFLTYAEVEAIFDDTMTAQYEAHDGLSFVGLDVGLSKDATASVVVQRVTDSQTLKVLDINTWRGSPGNRVNLLEVEGWCFEAAKQRFYPSRFCADAYQAVSLVQRMREHGVHAEDISITQTYRSRLFSNLLDVIRGGRLKCFPHEELKKELIEMEFRDVKGNIRVDHRATGHDDIVVALGMAVLSATDRPAPKRMKPLVLHMDIGRRACPWKV